MVLLPAAFITAVDIAEQELESVSDSVIEFLNYEGPHDRVESAEEIRSIGFSLNRSIQDGEEGLQLYRGRYFDKYRIVHLVAPSGQPRLNADIFIIDPEARVDHIKNIRRIISSYLEGFYSIPVKRADTLATFVTYYNAVYRGNMEYLKQTYNSIVIDELDPEKAGIARRYDEWPGKSQLLIPLTASGGVQAPSAETLGGDEKVVEELRQQEDRGVEERKEMVEMREEELDREREALEEEKSRSEEQAEAAPSEEGTGERPSDDVQTAEEAGTDRGEEEDRDAEIARREEELDRREEGIAEERERIAEDQQELLEEESREEEQRERELREDVGEVAEAEQEEPAATAPRGDVFPFILVEEKNESPFGTLVLVGRRGEIKKRSTLNTIRSRSVVNYKDLLLIAAGEDNPPRTVRLVALGRESLEVEKQSDTDVFSGTTIVVLNESVFCIVREEGAYYLGRFDGELRMEKRSEQEIARFSSIQPADRRILVQAADGGILFLDPETLK